MEISVNIYLKVGIKLLLFATCLPALLIYG